MNDRTDSYRIMLTPEQALEAILRSLPAPSETTVELHRSSGMVLAEDIASDIDMPPFDRSAMDGYALAGEAGSYRLADEVPAGTPDPARLEAGAAAPIMTGAPVPPGADRVLMLEKSSVDGGRLVTSAVPQEGENICFRGEDMRRGQLVLPRGSLLDSKAAGVAAMAGRASLRVYRRPVLSILTTGNEVVAPGALPGPGQVRNANMPMLLSLASACGFEVARSLHAEDSLRGTTAAAGALLASSDVLIAAGGISLGAHDHVAPALEAAGTGFLFREVALKPGKPFSFGMAGDRPVFCLPGNPVSVFCTFLEFVTPALRRMSGHERCSRTRLQGICRFEHRQRRGRTNLLRVIAIRDQGQWFLDMPGTSGSGDLMSTAGTNAIAFCDMELDGVSPGGSLPFSLNWESAQEASWE